jgi:hypothetical protein
VPPVPILPLAGRAGLERSHVRLKPANFDALDRNLNQFRIQGARATIGSFMHWCQFLSATAPACEALGVIE